MGTGNPAVDRLFAVCQKYVGYNEGPKDNQNIFAPRVGHANYQPWCASAVNAVMKEAGVWDLLPSHSAYTPTSYAGFVSAGQALPKSALKNGLQPGDIVYFQWPGLGRIAHIAIFVRYDRGKAVTYEGNTNAAGSRTGGSFLLKSRKIGPGGVTHAGRPKWANAVSPGPAVPPAAHPAVPAQRPALEDDMARLVYVKTADKKISSVLWAVDLFNRTWIEDQRTLNEAIALGLLPKGVRPVGVSPAFINGLTLVGRDPFK